MAWPMLEWVVANRYELPMSSGPAFESLLVFGAHESELIPLLETAQEQYPGLKLSSLPRFPREGTRQLELGARGDKQHVQQVIIMLKETLLEKGYQIQENS
jgi:molybdopterin-biosynthesis enzyme MoeA-like protein